MTDGLQAKHGSAEPLSLAEHGEQIRRAIELLDQHVDADEPESLVALALAVLEEAAQQQGEVLYEDYKDACDHWHAAEARLEAAQQALREIVGESYNLLTQGESPTQRRQPSAQRIYDAARAALVVSPEAERPRKWSELPSEVRCPEHGAVERTQE